MAMKKRTCYLFICCLLGTINVWAQSVQGTAEAAGLKDLFWIIGSWRGEAEQLPFFESYEVENDSLITIKYYADPALTTVSAVGATMEESKEIYHTYGSRSGDW
jgi:hypothetical protein